MSDLPSRRLCVQVYSPYQRVAWVRQWRESKSGDFPRKLADLVKELESEAANIVKRFEEGERQAEIERLRREEERRAQAREEAERRRLKSIKDSRDELSEIINAWAKAKRIEEFFADVERRTVDLEDDQRETVMDRLMLARKMVDTTDALKWLTSWKTPEERNSKAVC
jgi:GTP1/Obg family GTP-binding protein